MATTVLTNFEQWKQFLSDRVKAAEFIGLGEDQITALAQKIGDFLSGQIQPQNEQERLLADLWKVADNQEQKTLARLMVKMVSDGVK